jgi:GntR family transcriptional regulator
LTQRLTQPLGGLPSLYRAVEEHGHAQRSEVLALEVVRDPDAAGRLGLADDAELVRLERLRYAGDEPLALDAVWLPATIARPLLDVDFRRTALYDELATLVGVRITAVDEELEPVVADEQARRLLDLDDGEALLTARRRGWAGDELVETRVTLLRGQRFVYTSSWRQDPCAPAVTTFRGTEGPAPQR